MARVAVVGAGAIGSQVLPHLARMSGVGTVIVVDRDRYETSNLVAQNISTSDVGKWKAQTQAARLNQVNPTLATKSVHMPVEDVPLAWLRVDVILACVDSRRARMVINQAAWRLGIPWIDAGIDASGLARVQAFLPADDSACLECAWDERDYGLVEQQYACHEPAPGPTSAPSELGGLAAALQVTECRKLLSGDREHLLTGRDLMIDVRHHRHYVTRFRRNPDCRMPDHVGWATTPFDSDPSSTTLHQLISTTLPGFRTGVRLAVAGQQFAVALTCTSCASRVQVTRLNRGEFRRDPPRCPACEEACVATGADLRDTIALDELPPSERNRPLTDLGLFAGDVVTLCGSETKDVHLELRGAAWPIEF